MVRLDLGEENVDYGSDFEPMPEGTYYCEITGVKVGESRQKKTPQIEIELTVRDEGSEFNNRKVWDYWYYQSPKAKPRMIQALEAITNKEWREDNLELDEKELVGYHVDVVVNQQTYVATNKATGQEEDRIKNVVDHYVAADIEVPF